MDSKTNSFYCESLIDDKATTPLSDSSSDYLLHVSMHQELCEYFVCTTSFKPRSSPLRQVCLIPILQRRKLELRDMKKHVYGHTASGWQSSNANTGIYNSKACIFNHLHSTASVSQFSVLSGRVVASLTELLWRLSEIIQMYLAQCWASYIYSINYVPRPFITPVLIKHLS